MLSKSEPLRWLCFWLLLHVLLMSFDASFFAFGNNIVAQNDDVVKWR